MMSEYVDILAGVDRLQRARPSYAAWPAERAPFPHKQFTRRRMYPKPPPSPVAVRYCIVCGVPIPRGSISRAQYEARVCCSRACSNSRKSHPRR